MTEKDHYKYGAERSTVDQFRNELRAANKRIAQLEAALREIAVGLTEEDNVADYHNRYQMCASRLCKVARDVLRATSETFAEQGEKK
jgi:chaperonin cofactor prefoldin